MCVRAFLMSALAQLLLMLCRAQNDCGASEHDCGASELFNMIVAPQNMIVAPQNMIVLLQNMVVVLQNVIVGLQNRIVVLQNMIVVRQVPRTTAVLVLVARPSPRTVRNHHPALLTPLPPTRFIKKSDVPSNAQ